MKTITMKLSDDDLKVIATGVTHTLYYLQAQCSYNDTDVVKRIHGQQDKLRMFEKRIECKRRKLNSERWGGE